jgi:hypothetical protein
LATILGRNAKKKTFSKRFIVTFAIFIVAYCIGLFSALNFEKGMITNASSVSIKIVYVMYSMLICDQVANEFRNKSDSNKNPNEDQNNETVVVEITLFLSSSEL